MHFFPGWCNSVPMSIAKPLIKYLDVLVTGYQRGTGLAIGTVSKKIYGNRNGISEILAGKKSPSLDKLDAVIETLRQQWPRGVKWPPPPKIDISGP